MRVPQGGETITVNGLRARARQSERFRPPNLRGRGRSLGAMLKDQPNTLVTVIGSALVALEHGGVALTIYTQERGSIGFRLSPRAIDVLRKSLDEAEAEIGQAPGGSAECARVVPGPGRVRSG